MSGVNVSREVVERLALFLEQAATYFINRPTGDEDRAHWANVFNAENATQSASTLRALRAALDAAEQRAVEAEKSLHEYREWMPLLEAEIDAHIARDEVQLAAAHAAGMEEAARIVEAEPEYPSAMDQMTPDLAVKITANPVVAIQSASALTKRSIVAAIRTAIPKTKF